MAEMTELRYNQLKTRLKEVNNELEKVKDAISDAAALGDLSENAEYETARLAASNLQLEKERIESELQGATIVEDTSGKRIVIGSMLSVTKCTKEGEPLGPEMELRLDSKGDIIIAKVLGVRSLLGSQVLNGTDGIYKVPCHGGTYYKVKKIV